MENEEIKTRAIAPENGGIVNYPETKKKNAVIKPRRGPKDLWESYNPILEYGEIGYEYINSVSEGNLKMKMGDGSTPWCQLSYALGGTDVDIIEDSNTHLLFRIKNLYILIFRDFMPFLVDGIIPGAYAPNDPVSFLGFSSDSVGISKYYLNPSGAFANYPDPFSNRAPTPTMDICGSVVAWVK